MAIEITYYQGIINQCNEKGISLSIVQLTSERIGISLSRENKSWEYYFTYKDMTPHEMRLEILDAIERFEENE